jgi:ATP-dependent 26S proteasome regulatory subunit
MQRFLEMGFASPIAAMEAFLEPYRSWIESVVGCPRAETLTLEFEFPFSHLVAEELMAGVELDRQCLGSASTVRELVRRWELSPGVSPRMELHASRNRQAPVTERRLAWDPHWKETPIALWLNGSHYAIVSVIIPYVSYMEKGALSWRQWVIVNRSEAAASLNLLRQVEPPRRVSVIGGRDISLPVNWYDWDSVLLDPPLRELVREDFEAFWESEAWFADHHLPYRRGYLLYGPPGNGKTSVVRIMACHPLMSAFSINFSNDGLPNDALSDLFQVAEDKAPAIIILEDLDRFFGGDGAANRSSITLPHLLTCLDGLAVQSGIVVVATANDPRTLDPAILKRPGRFDRLAAFPLPSLELRTEYLRRFTSGTLDDSQLAIAANRAEHMSFAQIREAYTLAGQRSFRRGAPVQADEILEAIRIVRSEASGTAVPADGRSVGFSPQSAPVILGFGSPVRNDA